MGGEEGQKYEKRRKSNWVNKRERNREKEIKRVKPCNVHCLFATCSVYAPQLPRIPASSSKVSWL